MQIFFAIVNTLLLVILFFYQQNRNKVLEGHLSEQRKLIDDTKSVVTQQATALEGQGKVVETALKYSEAFNPDKIEAVIRREIEIDHKMKVDQLKMEFEAQILDRELKVKQFHKLFADVIDSASAAASQAATNFIMPFIPIVSDAIISMPKEEREKALKTLPKPIQSSLRGNIERAETALLKILNGN